jgi:predicted nuclease of predicted toxin-antitoxin system
MSNPTDSQLWDYSRQNELAIVSKDADFSQRIITQSPPPWVVHLRFGNLRLNAYHDLLARVWPQVESAFEIAQAGERLCRQRGRNWLNHA